MHRYVSLDGSSELDSDLTFCCQFFVSFFYCFSIKISFSRGKKRYLFDFRFELKWEAPDLDCGPAKGVLVYPDVAQDCGGKYDVECQVKNKTVVLVVLLSSVVLRLLFPRKQPR